MSQKLPSLNFYIGDWRKDIGVQSLSYHDRGVWFEILCLMHEADQRGKLMLNGQPMSEEVLARLLGLDKQVLTNTLNTILAAGVASREAGTGLLFCRRMVRDENLRLMRQQCGKMGGNPVLVKQNSKARDKPPDKPPDKYEVIHAPANENANENEIAIEAASLGEGAGRGMVRLEPANPPTLEQWLTNADMLGYDRTDAESVWHDVMSIGWLNRGQPIFDWRRFQVACRSRFQQRVQQFRNGKQRKRGPNPIEDCNADGSPRMPT